MVSNEQRRILNNVILKKYGMDTTNYDLNTKRGVSLSDKTPFGDDNYSFPQLIERDGILMLRDSPLTFENSSLITVTNFKTS